MKLETILNLATIAMLTILYLNILVWRIDIIIKKSLENIKLNIVLNEKDIDKVLRAFMAKIAEVSDEIKT